MGLGQRKYYAVQALFGDTCLFVFDQNANTKNIFNRSNAGKFLGCGHVIRNMCKELNNYANDFIVAECPGLSYNLTRSSTS